MEKSREDWCKKYNVKIANNGFIDKYCMPNHVECVLPNPETEQEKPYFIGFDGKSKTCDQLTDEEKSDYKEQLKEIPKLLNGIINRSKRLGKEER